MIFIDLLVLLAIVSFVSIWVDRRWLRNRKNKEGASE